MASTTISISSTNVQQRKFIPTECRPRMLKDFLNENLNSCSSSGFQSFPRKPSDPMIRDLLEFDLKSCPLPRSRSMVLSSSKSTFHAILNVFKSISFTAVKSPSILPRSLSRKLSKRNWRKENETEKKESIKMVIKIKDIIRWKSFRDLVEEQSPPLDFTSSPQHCTTFTTTTGSSGSTSSKSSSLCDSDFTSEYLPSWDGNSLEFVENDIVASKKLSPIVGKNSVETTAPSSYLVGPKELLPCQEEEEHSPVSVLGFHFEENEEPFLPFEQQKVAHMEKENGVEEKAMELLQLVKAATSTSQICKAINMDQILLEFFKDELNTWRNQIRSNDGFELEILRIAKDWMNEQHHYGSIFGYDIEQQKDACIRCMDKEGRWSKFGEEQEELGLEIECGILDVLVDELLNDFFSL
ncbi:DUF4378 domain protein [Quillaja saponaria]|uniref:DUF4378 domain protein n=1 Tax=Quillaja saponaria TaxID=32244 RepID=A0AAD7PPH6_QUISA|nr:DUF4378 domain protein [Quillaja saponaria]